MAVYTLDRFMAGKKKSSLACGRFFLTGHQPTSSARHRSHDKPLWLALLGKDFIAGPDRPHKKILWPMKHIGAKFALCASFHWCFQPGQHQGTWDSRSILQHSRNLLECLGELESCQSMQCNPPSHWTYLECNNHLGNLRMPRMKLFR